MLVRIETCGLCHTDIHAARGDWPVKPTPPFIPGHEGVGIVERLGAGNTHGIERGMRVALPWLGYACGDCALLQQRPRDALRAPVEHRLRHERRVRGVRGRLCPPRRPGPAGILPADASPLTCAGVTTYKAVKVAGASSADLIAVFGVGGLGHLAVQYAAITGAAVVAVDVNEERLRTARRLGAEHVVHAAEQDPVAAIRASAAREAAISTAVSPPRSSRRSRRSPAAAAWCAWASRPRTRCGCRSSRPCSAASPSSARSSARTTTWRRCSRCTRRGKTTVERAEVPLDDVNAAIESVLDGTAGTARTVLWPVPVADAGAPARRGSTAAAAREFDHTGAFEPGGVIGLPTRRSGGTVAGR